MADEETSYVKEEEGGTDGLEIGNGGRLLQHFLLEIVVLSDVLLGQGEIGVERTEYESIGIGQKDVVD